MSAQLSVTATQRRTPLRIAVVQLRPKIGDVQANIARARELCFKLQPHSIDLLCFSEMAFTGYVFESAEAIAPFLEEPKTGPTSLFCQEVAKYLGCYVAGGYPERLFKGEHRPVLPSESHEIVAKEKGIPTKRKPGTTTKAPTPTAVGANSAIIYNPSGEWVGGYRKTNLFETDETWAKPGTGFASFTLTLPATQSSVPSTSEDTNISSVKMSVGICMDLNPFPPGDWTGAGGPFELADYCVENQSKLLVLLNAWLYSDKNDWDVNSTESESGGDADDSDVGAQHAVEPEEPDWYTLRYWTARLRPLWRYDRRRRGSNETLFSDGSDHEEDDQGEEDKPPHETVVVVCNRTGKENGKTFAGSSAIFSMTTGAGRPKLLDMMGKDEEGVRVWNLLI